jgi:hypothetical protein
MLSLDSLFKWTATIVLILGSYINSAKVGANIDLGPWLLVAGGVLWLVQSIRWRESALIVTNAFMVIAGGTPLVLALLQKYNT